MFSRFQSRTAVYMQMLHTTTSMPWSESIFATRKVRPAPLRRDSSL